MNARATRPAILTGAGLALALVLGSVWWTGRTGAQPLVRYVRSPRALRYHAPSYLAATRDTFPVGTRLELRECLGSDAGVESFCELVARAGTRGGWIRASAVQETPPSREAFLAAARQALLNRDLAAATREAEGAAALAPEDPESWRLLAAVHDATRNVGGARHALRRLAELADAGRFDPPAPSRAEPLDGGRRFVAEPGLAVRARPDPAAEMVGALAFGAPLEVHQARGGWLQVRAEEVPQVVELGREDALPNPAQQMSELMQLGATGAEARAAIERARDAGLGLGRMGRALEGWVEAGAVVDGPPTRALLLFRAEQAALAHQRWEEVTWLERAARVAGYESTPADRLIRGALELGRYDVAARAVAAASAPGAAGPLATATALFGCRGRKELASLVSEPDFEAADAGLGEDVCLLRPEPPAEGVELPPCPPPDSEELLDTDELEALESARREDQAAREEFHRAQAEHRDRVAKARERSATLRASFPLGPFLRVTLSSPPRATQPVGRLFAYALPFRAGPGACGRAERVVGAIDELWLWPVPISWPEPGASREVWIQLPPDQRLLAGLVEATELTDAWRRLEASPREVLPGEEARLGPAPNAVLAAP